MCQSYLLLVPVNLVSGGVDDSGGRCLPLIMGLRVGRLDNGAGLIGLGGG